MSSDYHAMCLSHTPAIILEPELTHGEAIGLNRRDGLKEHQDCDVIVGRWSGGLVALACLGIQLPGPTGCKGYHSSTEWIDRDWLRLLIAAITPAVVAAAVIDPALLRPFTQRCWTPERLRSLRDALTPNPAY